MKKAQISYEKAQPFHTAAFNEIVIINLAFVFRLQKSYYQIHPIIKLFTVNHFDGDELFKQINIKVRRCCIICNDFFQFIIVSKQKQSRFRNIKK